MCTYTNIWFLSADFSSLTLAFKSLCLSTDLVEGQREIFRGNNRGLTFDTGMGYVKLSILPSLITSKPLK